MKFNTTLLSFFIIIVSLIPCHDAISFQRKGHPHKNFKNLRHVSIKMENGKSLDDHFFLTLATGGVIEVSVDERRFKLVTTINDGMLFKGSDLAKARQSSIFLKGIVQGYPNSVVRLTLFGRDRLEGFFSLDAHTTANVYHLELIHEHEGETPVVVGAQYDLNHAHTSSKDWKIVAYKEEDILKEEENNHHCGNEEHTDHEESHGNERHQLFKRSTANTPAPANPDCAMAMIADITVYNTYGSLTQDYMLSIMNDVQASFLAQFNVGLPVIYVYVVTSTNDASMLGTPPTAITDLLNVVASSTYSNLFPGYSQIANKVCLLHAVTNQDFTDSTSGTATLGLAALGLVTPSTTPPYGICASSGYNVGVSTNMAFHKVVTRRTQVKIMTHEIGHGFGSIHDSSSEYTQYFGSSVDTSTCIISSNPFLMNPSFSLGSNGGLFSPCSKNLINSRLQTYSGCLVNRGSSTNVKSTSGYPDTGSQTYDQCTEMGSNYVTWPYYYFTERCVLTCADPAVMQPTVWTNGAGGYASQRDGTICNFNLSRPNVCLGGTCGPDTRPYVCNRALSCCDSFGVLRPSSQVCNTYSSANAWTNACKPPVDYCDPLQAVGPDSCPITLRAPGSPCANCIDPKDPSTCSGSKTCGAGASFGLCIDPGVSSTVNSTLLCSQKTCPTGTTCVTLAGNATCIQTEVPTCQYLCKNDLFSYIRTNGLSWNCDCKSDCQARGKCCGDYQRYCSYSGTTSSASSTTTSFSSSSSVSTSAIVVVGARPTVTSVPGTFTRVPAPITPSISATSTTSTTLTTQSSSSAFSSTPGVSSVGANTGIVGQLLSSVSVISVVVAVALVALVILATVIWALVSRRLRSRADLDNYKDTTEVSSTVLL